MHLELSALALYRRGGQRQTEKVTGTKNRRNGLNIVDNILKEKNINCFRLGSRNVELTKYFPYTTQNIPWLSRA